MDALKISKIIDETNKQLTQGVDEDEIAKNINLALSEDSDDGEVLWFFDGTKSNKLYTHLVKKVPNEEHFRFGTTLDSVQKQPKLDKYFDSLNFKDLLAPYEIPGEEPRTQFIIGYDENDVLSAIIEAYPNDNSKILAREVISPNHALDLVVRLSESYNIYDLDRQVVLPKKSDIQHQNIFENDDDSTVREYADDIMTLYHDRELNEFSGKVVLPSDLTANMYKKVVDWIAGAALRYNLLSETYFQCIYIIKNCLQSSKFKDLKRSNFQLLGGTALFISSKNEERHSLEIRNIVFVADGAYTKKQVLKMERKIVKELQFHINYITPQQFIRILDKLNLSETGKKLSQYIIEYVMYDYNIISTMMPSQITAGAICLANNSNNEQVWNNELEYYLQVGIEDAKKYANKLFDTVTLLESSMGEIKDFVYDKFSKEKRLNVTMIPLSNFT